MNNNQHVEQKIKDLIVTYEKDITEITNLIEKVESDDPNNSSLPKLRRDLTNKTVFILQLKQTLL